MPETTGNVVIGQSLQLLTKIGVRYQGHLSAVDAEKRTITLNKGSRTNIDASICIA